MQHFYDGQIRRYITQLMRLVSNFSYKDSKGNLTTIPVNYGDLTRQVAHIIRDNSENKIPNAPRMSVYITGLEQDRSRTSDATYVSKMQIRERLFDENNNEYYNTQGKNYTVERLMPTPYILKVNVDLWTTNTDQKLQILEQILVLFNPSLEIQTTDNYVDWTSISVVNLEGLNWSNRSLPIGVDSEIDVSTISFSTPIYISAPVKVKKMGVITNIIQSIFDENTGTVDLGLSRPELNRWDDSIKSGTGETGFGRTAQTDATAHTSNVNYEMFGLYVEKETAKLIHRGSVGTQSWRKFFEQEPGQLINEVSRITITNLDVDSVITGTIVFDELDEYTIYITWDTDTFPEDNVITGPTGDRTSIDYIIDPLRFDPNQVKSAGLRLLLLDDVGSTDSPGAIAWKNTDGSYLNANANDIVEWDGSKWHVIFDSENVEEITYVTNLRTGQQYRFNNNEWLLSVDGEYPVGTWNVNLNG